MKIKKMRHLWSTRLHNYPQGHQRQHPQLCKVSLSTPFTHGKCLLAATALIQNPVNNPCSVTSGSAASLYPSTIPKSHSFAVTVGKAEILFCPASKRHHKAVNKQRTECVSQENSRMPGPAQPGSRAPVTVKGGCKKGPKHGWRVFTLIPLLNTLIPHHIHS